MESYKDFSKRIKELSPHTTFGFYDDFIPNNANNRKINSDNTFRDFYGDTVAFDLADEEKSEIKSIASPLYECFGECFAERINPATYHVTLHDLCSDNNLSSIADRMADNERSIKDLQKGYLYTQNIVVESTFVFNMVGSSIVLGFIPKEETGYRGLIELKQIFQTIYPIDYPLTPHVTLAYFSQNGIDSSKRAALYKLLVSLSTKSVTLSLNTDRLLYQKFRNMNHYYNTFKIGIHNAFV